MGWVVGRSTTLVTTLEESYPPFVLNLQRILIAVSIVWIISNLGAFFVLKWLDVYSLMTVNVSIILAIISYLYRKIESYKMMVIGDCGIIVNPNDDETIIKKKDVSTDETILNKEWFDRRSLKDSDLVSRVWSQMRMNYFCCGKDHYNDHLNVRKINQIVFGKMTKPLGYAQPTNGYCGLSTVNQVLSSLNFVHFGRLSRSNSLRYCSVNSRLVPLVAHPLHPMPFSLDSMADYLTDKLPLILNQWNEISSDLEMKARIIGVTKVVCDDSYSKTRFTEVLQDITEGNFHEHHLPNLQLRKNEVCVSRVLCNFNRAPLFQSEDAAQSPFWGTVFWMKSGHWSPIIGITHRVHESEPYVLIADTNREYGTYLASLSALYKSMKCRDRNRKHRGFIILSFAVKCVP